MRVYLHDGRFYELMIVDEWLHWLDMTLRFQGIVLAYGWIPMATIKLIAPIDDSGKEQLPDNVVPLRRPVK